ncbi:unnamed protein product [Amoebophrya sp. A120]|nr:unnamed protein product [Amoebophrya sp. A120]|eukprot:GSA120T00010063001.1
MCYRRSMHKQPFLAFYHFFTYYSLTSIFNFQSFFIPFVLPIFSFLIYSSFKSRSSLYPRSIESFHLKISKKKITCNTDTKIPIVRLKTTTPNVTVARMFTSEQYAD